MAELTVDINYFLLYNNSMKLNDYIINYQVVTYSRYGQYQISGVPDEKMAEALFKGEFPLDDNQFVIVNNIKLREPCVDQVRRILTTYSRHEIAVAVSALEEEIAREDINVVLDALLN